jgi:hypothetical protein
VTCEEDWVSRWEVTEPPKYPQCTRRCENGACAISTCPGAKRATLEYGEAVVDQRESASNQAALASGSTDAFEANDVSVAGAFPAQYASQARSSAARSALKPARL